MMPENKLKIIITDDHKLFRKGMSALLSDFDFIEVIEEAGNGEELINILKSEEKLPDVILLDLKMPVMDGMEANRIIKKLYPQVKVIILTMEDDEQYILHLINAGVNGYLLKNAEPEEVEKSIVKVVENGYYFSDDISALILKSLKSKDKTIDIFNPEFTERELQVLDLICREYSNGEIADKLKISIRTAEGYRNKLVEKSGAKNIAGLVLMAVKNKWVTI